MLEDLKSRIDNVLYEAFINFLSEFYSCQIFQRALKIQISISLGASELLLRVNHDFNQLN